jgi:uncharacterized Zn-binding protein involved in type VI secretion
MLQMRGVVHPGTQPHQVGTLLERCNTLRQEIIQHHHGGQPFAGQEADPHQHKVIVQVHIGVLLLVSMRGHRCASRMHQPFVGLGLHPHLVLPPVVPPTRGEGGNVLRGALGPLLEVEATNAWWLLALGHGTWK